MSDLEDEYYAGEEDAPAKARRPSLDDCRSPREYARFYASEGRKLLKIAVPGLPKGDGLTTGKECLDEGWTKPDYTVDPEFFSDDYDVKIDDPTARIGVKLGEDDAEFDFDHPHAAAIYMGLYGAPGRSTGNSGYGVGRIAIKITDQKNPKTVSFSIGRLHPKTGHKSLVELLCAPKQVVYAPTISGRTKTSIVFFHTGKPDRLTYAEAVERARNVSLLCAIGDVWNSPVGDGGRQYNSLALCRVLEDHFGYDTDEAAAVVRKLCEAWGDEEWHKRCDRPKDANVPERIGLPYLLEHLPFTNAEREEMFKWFKSPSKRGKGHNRSPKVGLNDLAAMIEALGVKIRRNLLTERVEVDGDDTNVDAAVLAIRSRVEAEQEITPGKDLSFDAVYLLADQNAYDPIVEYLQALSWDGVPRLDTWLIDHCGAEDTPLNRAIGELHIRASIARAFEPGCKYDYMLVLEGEQGLRKSWIIRAWCPDESWFTDNVSFSNDDKRIVEGIIGHWHVEFPEMKGMRGTLVEFAKAFIARQYDKLRMAYGREVRVFPRRCVQWGTVNDATYLRDPTGNRRIYPVPVLKMIDIEAFLTVRDQLLAEAVVRWNENKVLALPDSLVEAARTEQEARVDEDPWELVLRVALEDHHGLLTASEALVACGVRKDQADQAKASRVANILFHRLKLPKYRTMHARYYVVGDPYQAKENGALTAMIHPEPPYHFTGFVSAKGHREGVFEGSAGAYDRMMTALPENARDRERGQ